MIRTKNLKYAAHRQNWGAGGGVIIDIFAADLWKYLRFTEEHVFMRMKLSHVLYAGQNGRQFIV